MHLSPEVTLVKHNELDVLEIHHPKVKAKIALQGAQLLSWHPHNAKQDILWLSDIEPFQTGIAIRGGIPICYPWFGTTQTPAHGTARIREWTLTEHTISETGVHFIFMLENEAKFEMALGETCELTFTHLNEEPAQLALHTYFNIGHIEQTEVHGLGTYCFDKLSDQEVKVPSPRIIRESVDCIYAAQAVNFIQDFANQRTIRLEHINATETVLWNPWQKAVSGMTETAYQNMVCVETARLSKLLEKNDTMSLRISL